MNKKIACIFLLVAFEISVIFSVSNKSKNPVPKKLTEDVEISISIQNTDLDGHIVFVKAGGLTLENIANGEIIISETVGAGTVTFKNCSDIDVTVFSKANILLDGKNIIKNLYINDNARISSTDLVGNKYAKKSQRKNVELLSEILYTEFYSDLKPVLEGGNFITINEREKENKTAKPENLNSGDLFISVDTNYRGNGARFFIKNRPAAAHALNVYKIHNGKKIELDWISKDSDETMKKRFFSEYYTYEYLDEGEEYVISFVYRNKNSDTVIAQDLTVIPKRGSEIKIDMSDAVFDIDEETGIVKWESLPKTNLPFGSTIAYQMTSPGGQYRLLGHLETASYEKKSINIYKDFGKIDTRYVYNDSVEIYIYYKTSDEFRFPIMRTSKIKFDAEKLSK